jgi:hypothetical protein
MQWSPTNGIREVVVHVDVVVLEVVVHVDEDVVVLEVVVHEDEDEDVVVLGKRASAYGYAPQKPYRPPIPSRITRQTRFEGNCSRKQCARKACVGNGKKQQQRDKREVS